jgi:hypothetical protein
MGLSLRSGFDWAMQAQIQGAEPGDGHFLLFGNTPAVVGRLEAGLQVFRNDGFDVRLEYGLSVGDGYVGTGAERPLHLSLLIVVGMVPSAPPPAGRWRARPAGRRRRHPRPGWWSCG